MPAVYRWGLSATPERTDGLHVVTGWVLGPELARLTYPDLLAGGHLLTPEVFKVPTAFILPPGPPKEHPVKRLIRLSQRVIRNAERNEIIVRLVLGEVRAGRTVLLLTGVIMHGVVLAKLLAERGVVCWPMSSRTKKADRRRLLHELRQGQIQCLVATQLADEALDVPSLDTVILAYPGRSEPRTQQRLGRIMRRFPGKGRPRLYDVYDGKVPLLVSRSKARDKVFREILGSEPQILDLGKP